MEAYLAYSDLSKPFALLCPIVALPFLELYTNGVVQSGAGFVYPHVTTWRFAADEGISTPSFSLLLPPPRTYSPLMASAFLTIMNKAYIKICMEICLYFARINLKMWNC